MPLRHQLFLGGPCQAHITRSGESSLQREGQPSEVPAPKRIPPRPGRENTDIGLTGGPPPTRFRWACPNVKRRQGARADGETPRDFTSPAHACRDPIPR